MSEWLGHPAVVAVMAGLCALIGTEVGRRITRRERLSHDADATLAAVQQYVIPHFEPKPGSELLTLPARVAQVEVTTEANRQETLSIGQDLRAHVQVEEEHHAQESEERALRQAETDQRVISLTAEVSALRLELKGPA